MYSRDPPRGSFFKEDVQMRLRLLSSLLAATALVAGCFGPGDIDRTQPDKVKKSIFKNADGTPKEYFYRQTVTDVPATTGVSFVGEQGDAERVVFEITEDYLYVYRSYGWLGNDGILEGDEGDDYIRPGTAFQGAPLAAYPISSHFDVKRSYNSATGEQTNVLVEDTMDLPWNQREYFRVNWGQNDIADFKFGFASVVQTGLASEIPEVDESNTQLRDRPIISDDYIDVTTRFHVEPENLDWTMYGYGKVPLCYLFTGIYKDCQGGTLKVRASFVPVDKLPRYADASDEKSVGGASDYTRLDYDDVRFEKFGFFRTERYAFNDSYDLVEGSQLRMANRWNLWKDAASCYDANADLPYGACEPTQIRPVVYYLNEDFPSETYPELEKQALANGEAWNNLFRTAIQATTGWSDDRVGDTRFFTICPNNPVEKGDPKECGAEGLNPQIGDLRYSMYYYVPQYQDASPLGYGPSAADPKTGEIIQGNAFYYGQPAVTIAQRTVDILKLELGIKTEEQIRTGEDVRDLSEASFEARSAAAFGPDLHANALKLADKLDIKAKGARLKRQVQRGEASVDKRATRRNAVKTSGMTESLLNNEIREVFALQAMKQGTPPNEIDATIAGALLDDDVLFDRRAERELRMIMAPSKTCMISAEDVFDEGLLGIQRILRLKFYDTSVVPAKLNDGVTEADVLEFMMASTMADTQLHEIGHTVGLRHNFAGSSDALNFGPDYWEARMTVRNPGDERSLKEWDIDAVGAARTSLNAAIEIGLRDNQDSSVMDYASTYGTTTTLGSYDLAAIKYAYGDVVEVFNSAAINPARAKLLSQGEVHYSRYPEVVSDAATPELRVEEMYDRKNVNYRKVKKAKDTVDGDAIEVPYSFCSDEYRDASATCALWDAGADNYERTHYAAQKYRAYRIFNSYKRERLTFGVDVFSYLSRVYSRDFTYMLNQYKNWVNDELIIRSDRPCLVVEDGAIVTEAADRFASPSCGLGGFVGTVETANIMAEVLASPDVGCYVRPQNGCYDTVVGNLSTSSPPDINDFKLVSTDPAVCDVHVPTQPAEVDQDNLARAAYKVTNDNPYLHVRDSVTCEGYVAPTVTAFVGGAPVPGAVFLKHQLDDEGGFVRPANTLYDRDLRGYYFYNKPEVIGSWWEKWLAVKAIGDSNTDFIGVDASSDTRSFLISLNTLFGDSLNNLVGSAITDNVRNYGAILRANGEVEVLPLLNLQTGGDTDRTALQAPPINPDQQYTFRLIAMYNAAYNGQYTDDFEFGESLFVGMARSVTDVLVPSAIRNDPTQYTEVTDPVSGWKYYALHQNRESSPDLYSIGFEYLREIKARYYVGGADGPGLEFTPEFKTSEFEPRGDLEIAQIMAQTVARFGYADVWSGDLDL